MKRITIRAELAADDQADSVEIRVTQGAVLLRSASVPAHDAAATFDMDEGDYVAHAFVLGAGREEAVQAFAVPQQDTIALQVP